MLFAPFNREKKVANCLESLHLSRQKRMTAVLIINVANGYSRLIVVVNRSDVAYSAVVKTEVYNGTIRKTSSFDEKLPSIRSKVFFTSFFSSHVVLLSQPEHRWQLNYLEHPSIQLHLLQYKRCPQSLYFLLLRLRIQKNSFIAVKSTCLLLPHRRSRTFRYALCRLRHEQNSTLVAEQTTIFSVSIFLRINI